MRVAHVVLSVGLLVNCGGRYLGEEWRDNELVSQGPDTGEAGRSHSPAGSGSGGSLDAGSGGTGGYVLGSGGRSGTVGGSPEAGSPGTPVGSGEAGAPSQGGAGTAGAPNNEVWSFNPAGPNVWGCGNCKITSTAPSGVTIQLPASDGDGPEALLWVSFLEPQDLTDAVIIAEIEGQGQKVTAKAYAQSVGASAPWADGGKVQLGLIAPTYVSFALDRPKYQDSQFDARQVSAVGLSFRNLVGADSATLTLVSLRIVRLEG